MKHILATVLLGIAVYASAVTVELDGSLQEWTGDGVTSYGAVKGGEYGTYNLYQTEDSGTLYYGISASQYNTRDDYAIVKIAIDIDGIANSGATKDTYNALSFDGSYRPEFILYAGVDGGDTFVYSIWDGSKWEDHSLSRKESFDGTTTGISVISTDVETEYAIDFAALGLDATSQIRTWAIANKNEQSANGYYYGWGFDTDGTATGDGFAEVPEPATLALLGLGGLFIKRRHKA